MSPFELVELSQPAWKVLESLRSGHNPPMATTSGIADHIVALEARQKAYEADITRLTPIILQRRAAIASTLVEIEQTKSLAAPIRALSREILLHIFSLIDVPRSAALSPKNAPCSLGHVCRFWRTLSRSTPSLWSSITVYRSGGSLDGYCEEVLEQHLFLSNPRPLDIVVEYPPSAHSHINQDEDAATLMSTLSGHSSRWRSFEILGSEVVLKAFLSRLTSGIHFKTLKSLKMRNRRYASSSDDAVQHGVSLPPTLTSLDMNFAFGKLTPHWPALISVTCPFSGPDSFFKFIAAAHNLGSLCITSISNTEMELPTIPFIHQKLCRLTLDTSCSISPVLDSISLPNLKELHIQSRGSSSQKRCEERICQLVQRSRCALQVLSLNCCLILSYLIPILELRSLVSLRIYLDDEFYAQRSASALLDTLTVTPTKQPLPGLQELEISTNTVVDFLFTNDRLPAMILSRWNVPDNVARLSKLTLSKEEYPEEPHPIYNTSALAFFLWDLEDRGLEVSWTIAGDDLLAEGREYARSVF